MLCVQAFKLLGLEEELQHDSVVIRGKSEAGQGRDGRTVTCCVSPTHISCIIMVEPCPRMEPCPFAAPPMAYVAADNCQDA